MVYLPTFTIKINYINVGRYTDPMDPIWVMLRFSAKKATTRCGATVRWKAGSGVATNFEDAG